MDDLFKIIVYSSFSGATVFLGGILSRCFEKFFPNGSIKEAALHSSIAFGGGIMIAAIAFVLIPAGMETLSLNFMVILFLSGAMAFFLLEKYISQKGGAASQLLAMLMDFVPEAIALGAIFATDPSLGLLLAFFIGLQNLPESFNAYLDLRRSGYIPSKCLWLLFFLSFAGVISALLGFYLLGKIPQFSAALMHFASGGILYLVFQDIAPMSKLEKSRLPAIAAAFGFCVGMVGEKIIG